MSCRQLVALVTEYLDGSLSRFERIRFERHVAVCPPCRAHLDQMRETIRGLQDNIAKLEKEVDEGRQLEARLPELRREIRAKELELETLKKIIPSEPEAQDLIRKLERMASENSIVVRSWTSQAKQAREFYFEWPISITGTGSYHNLGKFFSAVSNYARIINIQGVKLNAGHFGGTRTPLAVSWPKSIRPDGAVRSDFLAFDAQFVRGARVALGDVNGDGYPDLIAASGPADPFSQNRLAARNRSRHAGAMNA